MGVKDFPNVPIGFMFVRPEELAGMRRDPEWCAAARPLIPDPALAHIRAMPSIGPAIEAAAEKLMRDNPPPPDALLPDGCARWWPRVDVVDREEGLCARLMWEARK